VELSQVLGVVVDQPTVLDAVTPLVEVQTNGPGQPVCNSSVDHRTSSERQVMRTQTFDLN
jgi:hypothetical protein